MFLSRAAALNVVSVRAGRSQVLDFVSGAEDPAAPEPWAARRQMIFAAAGHKITVAPIPSGHAGAPEARVETAAPRYFADRGHKVQRHQLTSKSSVVLPGWRMLLVGGSDDKIRICH